MELEEKSDEIDYENLSSDELIEFISFKEEYPKEAERAFIIFCSRFQKDVLQKAEIYSSKFGYSEVEALDIANCAFARVWKYHSFNKEKANSKNIDRAVLLWLYPIVYNELVKYKEKHTCTEPDEEDFTIAESIDDLVFLTVGDDLEKKKELRIQLGILEKGLKGLSEKQRIIFLTYKAYENTGKNIPRKVSATLCDRLDLVPSSIRVYKKQAIEYIKNYLDQLNGKG